MRDERLPEHCPETAQSHFLQKMNEPISPLIEARNYPLIFCFHYLETEKGQNRSPVLNLIQTNIEFVSNLPNDHEPEEEAPFNTYKTIFIMQPL